MRKSDLEEVMYGRKRSLFAGSLLKFVSIFYEQIIRLRHGLYRLGIIKQVKLKQSVISVGNITVGGTGKTPAVMQIARVLLTHERHPAVVSRGYGRRDENVLTVVSDGKMVLADPGTGGDEPVLIGSKVLGVPVVAASDRLQAAQYAHEKFRNDTVILDDGFQHIRLARDLDIVLVDAVDPFGNGKLFPAGILREPLSALRRADVVVITHADRAADLPALRKAISRHTGARIFTSRLVPVDLIDLETGEQRPLSRFTASAFWCFRELRVMNHSSRFFERWERK